MKFTWILLMAIYSASSVCSNFQAMIADDKPIKKDFLVVGASEVHIRIT
jgi:hypothetical protein